MGKLSMELYLVSLSKRYRTANKHEKGKILNELCESSGFHKKHAIRLLNSYNLKKPRSKTKKKVGRPKVYSSVVYLANCIKKNVTQNMKKLISCIINNVTKEKKETYLWGSSGSRQPLIAQSFNTHRVCR